MGASFVHAGTGKTWPCVGKIQEAVVAIAYPSRPNNQSSRSAALASPGPGEAGQGDMDSACVDGG